MAKTNTEVARILNTGPSMASRMRAGKRIGSNAVLLKISDYTQAPLDEILRTAEAARAGDLDKWLELMETVYADPESAPGAGEPVAQGA